MYIPNSERTPIEKSAYEITNKIYLKTEFPTILDTLGKNFLNIKQKGVVDKLQWDADAEDFVMK